MSLDTTKKVIKLDYNGVDLISTGRYLCRAIDYDGTILKEEYLNEGDTFTLPEFPIHDKLIAQEWSATSPIVDNNIIVNGDIRAGVVYTTQSGLTEFDIELTKSSGLTISLQFNGTKNWGDGTSDTTNQHTYSAYGKYTITTDASDIISNVMFSNLFDDYGKCSWCTAIRLGNNVRSVGDIYATSIKTITIPNSVTAITYNNEDYGVGVRSDRLQALIVPNNVPCQAKDYSVDMKAKKVIIPYGTTDMPLLNYVDDVVIPETITTMATLRLCSPISVAIPKNVTSMGGIDVYSTDLKFPENLVSISGEINAPSVKSLVLPNTLTEFGGVRDCMCLEELILPPNVTKINQANGLFYGCKNLQKVIFSENLQSINRFVSTPSPSSCVLDFSNCKQVCVLSNATSSFIGDGDKIIVPDNLYDEWIAATNWSKFANYIYKSSEVNE